MVLPFKVVEFSSPIWAVAQLWSIVNFATLVGQCVFLSMSISTTLVIGVKTPANPFAFAFDRVVELFVHIHGRKFLFVVPAAA